MSFQSDLSEISNIFYDLVLFLKILTCFLLHNDQIIPLWPSLDISWSYEPVKKMLKPPRFMGFIPRNSLRDMPIFFLLLIEGLILEGRKVTPVGFLAYGGRVETRIQWTLASGPFPCLMLWPCQFLPHSSTTWLYFYLFLQ